MQGCADMEQGPTMCGALVHQVELQQVSQAAEKLSVEAQHRTVPRSDNAVIVITFEINIKTCMIDWIDKILAQNIVEVMKKENEKQATSG